MMQAGASTVFQAWMVQKVNFKTTFLHQVDHIHLNPQWFHGVHMGSTIRPSGISSDQAGSPTILGFTHHNLETLKRTYSKSVSNNTSESSQHVTVTLGGSHQLLNLILCLERPSPSQLDAVPVPVYANLPLPFYSLGASPFDSPTQQENPFRTVES